MSKFATHYSKKAIKDSGLKNTQDWFYLIGLIDGKTQKKSEHIHKMLSEFPKGVCATILINVFDLVFPLKGVSG
jgi:hypothetical protein